MSDVCAVDGRAAAVGAERGYVFAIFMSNSALSDCAVLALCSEAVALLLH